MRQPREEIRPVPLHPQELREREGGADGEGHLPRELRRLLGRLGVAPQLGGHEHAELRVERHEAVLLARDRHRHHCRPVHRLQRRRRGPYQALGPRLWVLFGLAGPVLRQGERAGPAGHDRRPRHVVHDRLHALASASAPAPSPGLAEPSRPTWVPTSTPSTSGRATAFMSVPFAAGRSAPAAPGHGPGGARLARSPRLPLAPPNPREHLGPRPRRRLQPAAACTREGARSGCGFQGVEVK